MAKACVQIKFLAWCHMLSLMHARPYCGEMTPCVGFSSNYRQSNIDGKLALLKHHKQQWLQTIFHRQQHDRAFFFLLDEKEEDVAEGMRGVISGGVFTIDHRLIESERPGWGSCGGALEADHLSDSNELKHKWAIASQTEQKHKAQSKNPAGSALLKIRHICHLTHTSQHHPQKCWIIIFIKIDSSLTNTK